MGLRAAIVLLAAIWLQTGCSRAPEAAAKKAEPAPPKITQFYATAPQLALGEKELLCYGVENAADVWLTPPRQQLTASLTRCIEVTPAETTTYKLTATSADGQTASQELTVTVGAARVKIIEVQVSTIDAKRGDAISLCVDVSNAKSVTIDPIGFKSGGGARQCTTHVPMKTTTYVVTARGADGDKDTEQVTVRVR